MDKESKKVQQKTPEEVSVKRKVTPEKAPKEPKRKKEVRTTFMDQDVKTLFAEAEAKKETYFIYIPSYARGEDISVDDSNLVLAEEGNKETKDEI